MCMENGKNKEEKIKELTSKREFWRTKIFWLALEIAFIFGIPAFAALFMGKALDKHFETERTILFSLLVVAFISSWFMVAYRYKSVKKSLDSIEKELSELKN